MASDQLHLSDAGIGLTLAELNQLLTSPGKPSGIADLLAAFQAVRLTAIVSGVGIAAAHPGLLPKLRGALGNALLTGACEGSRLGSCRCRPACTAAVLFAAKPRMLVDGVAQEGSKPFVISAARHGARDLALSVTLFGIAASWAEAVRQALGQAAVTGLPWALLGKDLKLSLPAKEPALISMSKAVEPPQGAMPVSEIASLEFVTGLELNNRADEALTSVDILRRLTARASLIAPWMSLDLTQDDDELRKGWDSLDVELEMGGHAIRQPRASSRTGQSWQSRTRLPIVRLNGKLDRVWPYIALGEKTHIGRGAAAGSGRYLLRAGD
jgi:hypothetical protein